MKTYQLTATSPHGEHVSILCHAGASLKSWILYVLSIGWTPKVSLFKEVA